MQYNITILVLALLLDLMAVGCADPPPAEQIRPVRAIKVGDATELQRRWFPGRAAAVAEVELSFQVSGPLISFVVDVGDEVKNGDLLASIDPKDFQTALASATASLDRSKANLLAMQRGARPEEIEALRAQVAKAGSTYKQALAEHNRNAQLVKSRTVTQSEFDISLARRGRAAAEVKKAEQDLRIGLEGAREEDIAAKEAEIRSLEAAVIDAANRLDYSTMRAPLDGRVVAKYADNFENVRAEQPILRLVNTAKIEMTVQIPENLMAAVQHVKTVLFRFDAFPGREFTGIISKVSTEASRTTRTFPVTGQIDQPEDVAILPGMAGNGRADVMETSQDEWEIVVPVGSVVTPETMKESFVWVIDESSQTVSRRSVTTGALTPAGIIVAEGLQTGEWIATAGVHSLHDGQQVRILQDDGS